MDTVNNQVAASTLSLMVRQIRCEAKGINSYELVDPEGAELPEFTAGSHIDIHIKPGVIRQYSLCNDPSERNRYVIAVLKSETGLGGSKALHESVHVQDVVKVSVPRNHFQLDKNAKKAVLLAGGIGITPLKSMLHHIEELGMEYELHYCAKDASCAAFNEVLSTRANVAHHFDNGDPSRGLDLTTLLQEHKEGTHVYFCGPTGFMDACVQATKNWPAESVHFEYFKAPVASRRSDTESSVPNSGYNVKIASTGQTIAVAAEQSLVEALAEAGIEVETSCVSGLCGTCKLRYLEGEVDHQDYILDSDEQREYLTACVSKAKSDMLVLDL